jgi:MIF4G domain
VSIPLPATRNLAYAWHCEWLTRARSGGHKRAAIMIQDTSDLGLQLRCWESCASGSMRIVRHMPRKSMSPLFKAHEAMQQSGIMMFSGMRSPLPLMQISPAKPVETKAEKKRREKVEEAKRAAAEYKARQRMLGNIQFIGQLYIKKMLTDRIMHECIVKLLGAVRCQPCTHPM